MRHFYSFMWVGAFLISLTLHTYPKAQEPAEDITNQSDTAIQVPGLAEQTSIPKAESSLVTVTSDPDSALVNVDEKTATEATPVDLILDSGVYQLEVIKEGYEPLTHELKLLAGRRLSARFILKSFPPLPVAAESLGLEYLPEKKIEDIHAAERVSSSFNRAAETFLIMPLGQGILARFIMDDNNRREANIMIISGTVLSVGSWILGKVLSNKKLRDINAANARIEQENKLIYEYNEDIDRQLKEANEQALTNWQQENARRGRVIIEDR